MASQEQEQPFSGMMSLQDQAAIFIRTPLSNALPVLQSQPDDSNTHIFPEFTLQTSFIFTFVSRYNGSYLVQELPSPQENIHSLGTISRQLLIAWAFETINQLQSLGLNKIYLSHALWDQLFRIIRNHDMYRNWMYSRPRNGLMQGSLVTLRDSGNLPQLSLTTANALIILRNIWEQIEIDVRDTFGSSFMGEIYLIVVEIWTFKYYVNNLVRSSKGLPHTTCSDAITEISRYTISQPFQPINTRPQPNPVAGNIGKPFDPSLSSIGLGNTSRMTAAQDQSRSSLRPNPNHLTDNKPQHNISATMVHNIKQEVDEEHKQGISSLPANPYSVPAPRNQRHSNAGASRISAPAPQSHFKLPNNSATGAGEIQHKRSAILSRENDTFTSAPSKKVKVEADTIRADTSFSPTRHGRAPSNPAAAGSDTPANTQVKNETSGKKIVSSSVQGKK